jgi:hypothetical protein
MLAEVERWRREESGSRSEQSGREKEALEKVESRLSRLLDVYIDGSIEHEDYALKKQEILQEKMAIKERIARIGQQGSAWLEPLESFLKEAIQGGKTANSENPEDLRDFYRRIGSNLSLTEPQAMETAVKRRTRTTEERAAKSACGHGGTAASASGGLDSDCPAGSQKSSSRYADRHIPVLRIEHRNPWQILSHPRKYKMVGASSSHYEKFK